jgi:hypothetical protein
MTAWRFPVLVLKCEPANLGLVKSFRILVLLLLTLLLPLRSAVAATMLCSTPGETSQVKAILQDPGTHASHAMHGDGADHDGSDHAGSHHDGKGGHADKCNLCVSGCNVTPLVSALPEVTEPLLTAELVFPGFSAPAPAFQSDGQERPPRSI